MASRPSLRLIAGLLLVLAVPSALLALLLGSGPVARAVQPATAAVVDLDLTQQIDGRQVNLGRELVRRLTTSDPDLTWVQVTDGDARRGVQSGRYVAMATVPHDFTATALAAASGRPVDSHVSVITSPMAPSAQSLVGRSVALATSRTVGTNLASATLDRVYLTFTDADAAFRTAAQRAATLAKGAGDLDQMGEDAQGKGDDVAGQVGGLQQQAAGLGSGPGLPSPAGAQQQAADANNQLDQQGALTADAQRAVAQAASESDRAKTAGQQSASDVAELEALATQLDQKAAAQQSGVDTYTTSVAAAAQRQRGMDASLKGVQGQLASFSRQLKSVTGASASASSPFARPTALSPSAETDPASLKGSLAVLQALVDNLETDTSVATAVTLATELKELADAHQSGLDGLEGRLVDLRRLYADERSGLDDALPVKCPYVIGNGTNKGNGNDDAGNNGRNDCRVWRNGVVTGINLSLDELHTTGLADQSTKLKQRAATNLTNVTGIRDSRGDLLAASRKAVVALQTAIELGTTPPEVIEKVAEIADEAEVLSTTAQALSTSSDQQSSALNALDKDSPAVENLATAATAINSTLTEQDDTIASLTATVAGLGRQLGGLATTITALNKQTSDLQTSGDGLRATLRQLDADAKQLDGELDAAKTQIDQQDARLQGLSISVADAEAASGALAKQLDQLRAQSTKHKQDSDDHAAALQQPSVWPTLDLSSKQRITAVLEAPAPSASSAGPDAGWPALVTTLAVWIGCLVASSVAERLSALRREAKADLPQRPWWTALVAPAVTSVLVGGAASAWLLPQLDAHQGAVSAVVLASSVAASAVAHALRRAIGPAGIWVGLAILGVTMAAFSNASPGWLDAVRDWAVTSPILDALRITMAGGGGIESQMGSMVVWTVAALAVAALATRRFTPAPAARLTASR